MANNLQTQILAVVLVALVAVDVSCAEETSGDRPNLVPIITTAAGKWHWDDAVGDHFDRIYDASTAGFVSPTGRTPDEFDRITGQPDHSARVRPRRLELETYATNGKY